MKPLLLGLHARPRAGKDTFAQLFIAATRHSMSPTPDDVSLFAYADGIYEDLCAGYGINRVDFGSTESKTVAQDRFALVHCGVASFRQWAKRQGYDMFQPRTTRFVMQRYGTDYMHAIDPHHWVKDTVRRIKTTLSPDLPREHVIVTDVRHGATEVEPLRKLARDTGRECLIIEIAKEWGTDHSTDHPSDKRLPPTLIDLTIQNVESQPAQMLAQLHTYLVTRNQK